MQLIGRCECQQGLILPFQLSIDILFSDLMPIDDDRPLLKTRPRGFNLAFTAPVRLCESSSAKVRKNLNDYVHATTKFLGRATSS